MVKISIIIPTADNLNGDFFDNSFGTPLLLFSLLPLIFEKVLSSYLSPLTNAKARLIQDNEMNNNNGKCLKFDMVLLRSLQY